MGIHLDLVQAEFFKDIPLFATLEWGELSELLRYSEDFVVPAGVRLFGEGDSPDGLYVIARGEVEVSIRSGENRELVLARLSNGSVVGEMSLIALGPRSASVDAVAQTSGYFLSRSEFDTLLDSGSLAAYKIVLQLARTLEKRRYRLERRIDEVRLKPETRASLMEQSTKELIARVRKA